MIPSTTSFDRPGHIGPATAAGGQPAAKPFVMRPDRVSTGNAAALKAALAEQPEVRADVVERAKALAADPNYPSRDILRHVARQVLDAPSLELDAS